MFPFFWDGIPQKAKSKTMWYTYSEQRAVLAYIGHSVIVRWVERKPFQKTELHVRVIHRTVSGLEQAPSRYSLNEWIKKAHPLPANLVTILFVFFSLLFSSTISVPAGSMYRSSIKCWHRYKAASLSTVLLLQAHSGLCSLHKLEILV